MKHEAPLHHHTVKVDGFDILFTAWTQDDPTKEDFPEGDMLKEIIRKMDNFELRWFQVTVTASKCGIELASDHLGGCCYNTYEEFYTTENGYWDDMVASAVNGARAMIERLAA